jgi:hypothetical protein
MKIHQLIFLGSLITVTQLSVASTSISCEVKPNGAVEATLPWQNVLGETANLICKNAFTSTQNSQVKPIESPALKSSTVMSPVVKSPPIATSSVTEKAAIVQRFTPSTEPKVERIVQPVEAKVNRITIPVMAKVIRFETPKEAVVVVEN